jgi:hypothetical protein
LRRQEVEGLVGGLETFIENKKRKEEEEEEEETNTNTNHKVIFTT